MSKEDQQDTKKKRLLKGESTMGPIDVKKLKAENVATKNDLKNILTEDDEALQREPTTDLDLFHTSCDFLKASIGKIKELKTGEKDNSSEIQMLRTDATIQFILMKKLNRLAHFRCRRAREATNEAKHKIDHCHLQLQNLLYEAMHLQKEITKCLEFKSKDEEIELVTVDEFYKTAPESISNPDVTKEDVHQQMLARLEWELEQRKQLAVKLTETQASKEKISQDIQAKQEYLETLQPKLAAILEATKPVQDYLDIPYDAIKEEHQKAQYLPGPLYVLYMQTSAYKEACDKGLTVSIQGDIDAAKSISDMPFELEEDSDSDQEEQEKANSKRRRKTQEARQKEKKNRVLQKHPLNVVLKISVKDEASLTLTFNYLLALKIVTVDISVNMGSKLNVNSISGSELLSPDLILDELYPGDHGSESPNVANHFELKKFGLLELSNYLSVVGRPYLWCQWMGGLQFLNKEVTEAGKNSRDPGSSSDFSLRTNGKPKHSVSASHMQETIHLLKKRLQARIALLELISSIERGNIPLSYENTRLFPAKINAKLTSWKRATFDDVKNLKQAERAISAGVVQPSDFIYTTTVDHSSAKMTAYVVITADCPQVVPFFILDIMWQSRRTALNDLHVMELEEELNLHHKELQQTQSSSHILALQLQRLLMCFDVYLETDALASSIVPVEIPKEKMIPRVTRGKARSKPYKYLPDLGIFTHRM